MCILWPRGKKKNMRKKSYKDAWMSEREVYCNDGWMFLNNRPTLMCLATLKEERERGSADAAIVAYLWVSLLYGLHQGRPEGRQNWFGQRVIGWLDFRRGLFGHTWYFFHRLLFHGLGFVQNGRKITAAGARQRWVVRSPGCAFFHFGSERHNGFPFAQDDLEVAHAIRQCVDCGRGRGPPV